METMIRLSEDGGSDVYVMCLVIQNLVVSRMSFDRKIEFKLLTEIQD